MSDAHYDHGGAAASATPSNPNARTIALDLEQP
jgi:hypothetical protein